MLNISGIEEGYVIDHIRAGSCMKIYDALNLDKCEGEVAIIKNAKSGKLGKKDIIKIEGWCPWIWSCWAFWTTTSPWTLSKTTRSSKRKAYRCRIKSPA